MIESGNGVPKDLNKAMEFYRKSAKQGNPNAQAAVSMWLSIPIYSLYPFLLYYPPRLFSARIDVTKSCLIPSLALGLSRPHSLLKEG